MSPTSPAEELVREFLVESYENLDSMDQDFVALERNPDDRETLARIFRYIHTIKGSCGFLGFEKLQGLTHAAENLLSLLREGKKRLTTELTNALLETADTVRETLETIEQTGREAEHDYPALIETLNRLQATDGNGAEEAAATAGSAGMDGPPGKEQGDFVKEFVGKGFEFVSNMDQAFISLQDRPEDSSALTSLLEATQGVQSEAKFLGLADLEKLTNMGAAVLTLVNGGQLHWTEDVADALQDMADRMGEAVATIGSTGEAPADDYLELIDALNRIRTTVAEDVKLAEVAGSPGGAALEARPEDPTSGTAPKLGASNRKDGFQSNLTESHIRVDVKLLDKLMNQVGELVLSRNQHLQYLSKSQDSELAVMSQHLNLVTSELQESIMAARLQPIGTVWNKYPRMIRDLALELGKSVSLKVDGADTELDRTIIEAIRDPMTHLVRNAIDHGIESPDQRKQAGKAEEGTLQLRAFHQGGQVNIEISDDGRGIDVQRVARQARERDLITPDQEESMTDREKLNLIFAPGFSMADEITNISGRGVGMDVVKSHIERINGVVDINSKPGAGTQIKVNIPLTLAIIPALIVTCAGQRYAIPQASLVALIRLQGEEVRSGIEILHNVPVHRWRGGLIPLAYLRQELEIEGHGVAEDHAPEAVSIVVLQAEERSFGLVVDAIDDSVEIVVKPLGRHLRGIPVFAGATIMGDGRVAMIIDVLGLAQSANVVSELGKRGFMEQEVEAMQDVSDKWMVLLVQSAGKRLAIPASEVERIETFSRSAIEISGEQVLVQYRGSVMPLKYLTGGATVNASPTLESPIKDNRSHIDVVVPKTDSQLLGLIVDEIIDVLEDEFQVANPVDPTPGVIGTTVIRGRVAELVDINQILLS